MAVEVEKSPVQVAELVESDMDIDWDRTARLWALMARDICNTSMAHTQAIRVVTESRRMEDAWGWMESDLYKVSELEVQKEGVAEYQQAEVLAEE